MRVMLRLVSMAAPIAVGLALSACQVSRPPPAPINHSEFGYLTGNYNQVQGLCEVSINHSCRTARLPEPCFAFGGYCSRDPGVIIPIRQ